MKCMNETLITMYLQKPVTLGMTQITKKVFITLQKVKITKSISLQSSTIANRNFFKASNIKKPYEIY